MKAKKLITRISLITHNSHKLTRSVLLTAILLALSIVLSAQTSHTDRATPSTYQVTDLGPLVSVADDVSPSINDVGEISTWVTTSDGSIHAVAGTAGQWKDLGTLPGDASNISRAINKDGQVVGWSVAGKNLVDSLVAKRAFLYRQGQLIPLGNFGGRDSQAMAINDQGEVVGVASLPDKTRHAFFYDGQKLHDLGTLPGGNYSVATAINNSGLIAGAAATKEHLIHAAVWENGNLRDLGVFSGGSRSQATAINNRGHVVGFSEAESGEIHAFLYANDEMRDLGFLGKDPSRANSINDHDQIVGHSAINDRLLHAFLWQQGKLWDLNPLVSSDIKWEIREAYSINNRGQILCSGTRPGKEETRLLLLNPQSGLPQK